MRYTLILAGVVAALILAGCQTTPAPAPAPAPRPVSMPVVPTPPVQAAKPAPALPAPPPKPKAPPPDRNVPPSTAGIPLTFFGRYPAGTQFRSLASIQAVFAANALPINALVSRHMASGQLRPGVLRLALAVTPEGHVAGARTVHDGGGNPDFTAQLVELVSAMDFGPATRGEGYCVFSYPLRIGAMHAKR